MVVILKPIKLTLWYRMNEIWVFKKWTAFSWMAFKLSMMKSKKLSLRSNERKRVYQYRWGNEDRQYRCTRSSKRRLSGANSTESTVCACSSWVDISSLCPFIMWFARPSASLWVNMPKTIVSQTIRLMCSESGEFALWVMQKMKFLGSSHLRQVNYSWMQASQLSRFTKSTIDQTSPLLALPSTKSFPKSVPYTSIKFSVSASRISYCTQMSLLISQYCSILTHR